MLQFFVVFSETSPSCSEGAPLCATPVPTHHEPQKMSQTTSQVRVRMLEGLEELSWGELEGKDSKLEPSKGRLSELKRAWDDGIFGR